MRRTTGSRQPLPPALQMSFSVSDPVLRQGEVTTLNVQQWTISFDAFMLTALYICCETQC